MYKHVFNIIIRIINMLSITIYVPTLAQTISFVGINIPSIVVARLFSSTWTKASINLFHVALVYFLNHNWNISLQHLLTSLGLLLSIWFNISSSSCSNNSRPKSCHLEETPFHTCLFNSLRAGRSWPVCTRMIINLYHFSTTYTGNIYWD